MSKFLSIALSIVLGLLLGACALYLPTKFAVALVVALAAAGVLLAAKDGRRVIIAGLVIAAPLSIGKALFEVRTSTSLAQGVSLELTDVLIVALAVMLAGKRKNSESSPRGIAPIALPAAVWVTVSGLSLMNAGESMPALIQLLIMAKSFLFFLIVALFLGQTGDPAPVLVGLAMIVTLEALLGLYEHFAGQPLGLLQLGEASTIARQQMDLTLSYRVQGTLGHPNSYGMYLVTAIPLIFAVLFCGMSRPVKIIAGGVVLLGIVGVLLSLSRSGWVCLVLALALVMALAVWQKRLKAEAALLTAAAMFLLVLSLNSLMSNLIGQRLTADDHGAAVGRLTLAQTALEVISDHPWVGVGLNNYRRVLPLYGESTSTVVHNVYLLIAAETGVIGLAAFLLLLAAVLKHAWRLASRPANDAEWVVGAGAGAALAGLTVWGMTDYALLGAGLVTRQFWLLVALVAGVSFHAAHGRARAAVRSGRGAAQQDSRLAGQETA